MPGHRSGFACLVLAVLLLMTVGPAEAERPLGPHLVIGLDLSKSNPLVKDKAYAAKVGDRVAGEIAALPLKSRVSVRTFGAYDSASNRLRIDEVVSARNRPDDIAEGVRQLIANVPRLVERGELAAQMHTNILPFLETMGDVTDCRERPTRFLLLTDGIEDSEYAKLTRTSGKLPPPVTGRFASCEELQILGLGQGFNSPKATERLRSVWGTWAQQAGFRRFVGLYDW